jgi:hypothetical protein
MGPKCKAPQPIRGREGRRKARTKEKESKKAYLAYFGIHYQAFGIL